MMEGPAILSPVTRTLYRSLLRLAIKYDKNPIAKGLLHRNDPKSHDNASSLYYSIILNQIFGKKKFYLPDDQTVSFRSIVQKEFRFPNEDFLLNARVDAAFKFLRKFSNIFAAYDQLNRREKAGEMALKKAGKLATEIKSRNVLVRIVEEVGEELNKQVIKENEMISKEIEDVDAKIEDFFKELKTLGLGKVTISKRNEKFQQKPTVKDKTEIEVNDEAKLSTIADKGRNKGTDITGNDNLQETQEKEAPIEKKSTLVEMIIKSICPQTTNVLQKGTLLLTHPGLVNTLGGSVVLLLEHEEESRSYGIVINKPGVTPLQEGVKGFTDEFYEIFKSNLVHSGGNIPRSQVIHNLPECGGKLLCEENPIPERPFNPPFFYSLDVGNTLKYLIENPEKATQMHFFAGCLIWDAHQLQQQVEEGFWIPVAANIPSLLNLFHLQTIEALEFSRLPEEMKKLKSKPTSSDARNVNAYPLILEGLSEDHAVLAKLPPIRVNNIESCD